MSGKVDRQSRLLTVGLLVSVALAACTGTSGAPGKPGGALGQREPTPLSVGTALVIRDILAPTLTYSGNVQARTSVNLIPKITGRLEKLNADIGDKVKAGDIIAELDHAQLDVQVRQSEAGLLSAQAKLEQTQASSKQEDIDAAQAAVDQAAVKLEQARAGGRTEEVAAAAATVDQLQARAEQVATGAREQDRANLQSATDQAEAQQDQFRAQVVSAQAALAEAKYRYDQAQAGLGGPGVRPEDIAQAQATLESNRLRLAQIKNPRAEDVRAAELAVDQARANLEAAENNRDACGDSKSTTSSTAKATGTGVPTVKTTSKSTTRQNCPDAQQDSLDAQVDAARVAVQIAENNLQKIKNPSPYDIGQAEQAVALAEANLQKLKFGGTSDIATLELRVAQTQSEVDRLQASMDQATSNLVGTQAKLDAAINPDPHDVRQARAAAQNARANLARTANPDPFVVQAAVTSVDQAKAQLASRIRPFTAEDIKVSAAGVEQAAAALDLAKVQAADAIIRAPFDASVSQKLLSPGALASPNTPILGLVSRDVEILVQVEEARLSQVEQSQSATLTVSAYPGRVFPAIVAAVSPSSDTKSRTFTVRIVPREQDGALRDGMFAKVSIAGAGQASLLVPNEAIVTQAGRSQVFVVVNDRVQAREVKPGESDGKRTAILEGRLNETDEVVVTNPELLSDGMPVIVEQRNMEPRGRPGTSPGSQPDQPAGPPSSLQGVLPASPVGGQISGTQPSDPAGG